MSTIPNLATVVESIDVCVVTRNGKLPTGLNYTPMANLIVETSRPLGLARQKAIAQVKTDWLCFVDDDSDITKSWWDELECYRMERVGAVQGDIQNVGLGAGFDQVLARSSKDITSLKIGERGFTHNTLIRTSLVRDWHPSSPKLEAYEDWEITQHILNKGFQWLVVPTTARHWISWRTVARSAVWGGRWWRQSPTQPTVREKLGYIYCLTKTAFRYLRFRGFRPFFYQSYFTLFVTLGLLLNLQN